MKQFFLFLGACMFSLFAFAQPRNTTVEFQKQMKPAVAADIPFPEKTVSDAIEDKLLKLGYKSSSVKGFMVFKGVRLAELSQEALDLYFMVDRVSKKDKGNSIVTLMLSKGFENFVSDSSDSRLMENAKTYLTGLRDIAAAYDLELQIAEQDDVLKKADKKYNGLVDDASDLQKKKKKLEDQIAQNIIDQKNQQDEIARQKQVLENLKAKRKP